MWQKGSVIFCFPREDVTAFKAGSFKSAYKAKAPIVPVALIDSYKAFNSFSFQKITTQVHYLKPLYYEEYKDMKTSEVALLVEKQIQEVITANTASSSSVS